MVWDEITEHAHVPRAVQVTIMMDLQVVDGMRTSLGGQSIGVFHLRPQNIREKGEHRWIKRATASDI